MRWIVDWRCDGEPRLAIDGFARLLIEVDEDGTANREIGFDEQGHVIHRFPGGEGTDGAYGICDMVRFESPETSDISEEEFERLWVGAPNVSRR